MFRALALFLPSLVLCAGCDASAPPPAPVVPMRASTSGLSNHYRDLPPGRTSEYTGAVVVVRVVEPIMLNNHVVVRWPGGVRPPVIFLPYAGGKLKALPGEYRGRCEGLVTTRLPYVSFEPPYVLVVDCTYAP